VNKLDARQQASVDEYGELKRQIDAFRPVVIRAKALEDLIESWYAGSPAEESFLAEGKRYLAQIGPRSMERKIVRMDRLYRKLGLKRFLAACTFRLGDVDRLVPKAEHPEFLSEGRTGRRPVDPVALPAKR
jgi:hypothetical protein